MLPHQLVDIQQLAMPHYEQVQLEAKRAVEEFAGELDFARMQKEKLRLSAEQQVLNEFK